MSIFCVINDAAIHLMQAPIGWQSLSPILLSTGSSQLTRAWSIRLLVHWVTSFIGYQHSAYHLSGQGHEMGRNGLPVSVALRM